MTQQSEQAFVKVLGRADVLAVGFGAMIGFGWVVLTGEWVSGAGTAGAALAFLVGGAVMVVVGLTYAELVAAMPKAGGEHHYVLRALGSRWSFVASWTVVLGYLSVVAFEAVALPETMLYLVPDLNAVQLWTVAGYDVHLTWALVGIAGAVAVTALNYVGVRPAAVAQTVVVVFLVAVGAVMLTGWFVGGSTETAQPWFTGGAAGLIGVLVAVPFLFVGFDVIPQSAEEIDLPERHVGRLLVVSVLMAVAFYVVVVVGVGLALDEGDLLSSQLATADGMAALWGHPAFGTLLVLGGIAGILTSWNAFLIGASRLVYAMGASGMLPAWFAAVHPRYRTPSHAILFIGGLSVLAPLFGDNMLTWLVNAGGIAITVGFLIVAVTFLVLRRREPDLPRPFRVSRASAVGLTAAGASVVLIALYLPGMPAALGIAEWTIVGAWWLVGLLFLLRLPAVGPGVDAEERLLHATGRPHGGVGPD